MSEKRVNRAARLRWVPLPNMKVSPMGQRELNPARVDRMAANFDPEQVGVPVLSERSGSFYIIDGQHRVEMLRQVGWGDQSIQCWVYDNLTEQEEAEMFLKLNDVLTVDAYWKFRIGVEAGREVECDIDRVVRAQGLVVSRDEIPGRIRCVGTLTKVYDRSDAKTLGRTLRLARDAYGDAGMEASVIDGLGLLCQRYNGDLDDEAAKKRLAAANGGVSGLLNKANQYRLQTGNYKAHCVAAAAVDIINAGQGRGKKLPSWWKS